MSRAVGDPDVRPSERSKIPSFKVMEVVRDAALKDEALAKAGSKERVLALHIGQPSVGAPRKVLEAASKAVFSDRIAYTGSLGIPPLRQKIADLYMKRYGEKVAAEDVIVTTGSSGGFVIAFTALFDAGMRVAMATPGYPCYRNILQALGCEIVSIPTTEESDWQPTPQMLDDAIKRDGKPIHGLIVTSPSNPTGTVLGEEPMKAICDWCTRSKVRFISDEIYHGLPLAGRSVVCALKFKQDSIIINSFSKYHCMTGWRVGWMVVKDKSAKEGMETLLQNLFISAPTLSQIAALSAFDCEAELDGHAERYRANCKILLEGLPKAGFDRLSRPDGAFYLYCDVREMLALTKTTSSLDLAKRILDECAVAVTSGVDFDPERGHNYIRFSFAGSTESMREACERLRRWHKQLKGSKL